MKIGLSNKPRTDSFALIIALMAVFVLSANAAMLWYSMQVDMKLAAESQSDPQLLWLGRSGVELAKYVLAQELTVSGGHRYDGLNQIWAGGPGGLGETNGFLSGVDLNHYSVGDGWVSIKIIDEERYININTVNPDLLQNVLTTMGVDANDLPTVSDSILDWVQPGDNPRLSGAKNQYYLSLNPPYYCKEAPMDDISELLLVKAVTRAMYDGEGEVTPPSQKKLSFSSPFQTPSYNFHLVDVFRTYGDGQINVNTANADVLECIPGVDQATAAAIIKTRAGPDGVDGTADDTPFMGAGDVQRAGINPEAAQNIGRFCGVFSTTFEVDVTAHIANVSRDYKAIVWRNSPQNIQTVSFTWVSSGNSSSPPANNVNDQSP